MLRVIFLGLVVILLGEVALEANLILVESHIRHMELYRLESDKLYKFVAIILNLDLWIRY